MKLFIALMLTLNTAVVFAAETESKCGQVADSVERSNPKTDTTAQPAASQDRGAAKQ